MSKGLYWFQHDLRLADNNAFNQIVSRVDTLHCVYILDEQWLNTNHYGFSAIGDHRLRFIAESLRDLTQQLEALGQTLHVYVGDPVSIIERLVAEHSLHIIGKHSYPGVFEQRQWQALKTALPNQGFVTGNSHTLYHFSDLPFSLNDMPDHFTPFRKKVEKFAEVSHPVTAPAVLPPPLLDKSTWDEEYPNYTEAPKSSVIQYVQGGASAGLKQIHYYMSDTKALLSYKETRNGLDGWDFSSKLSAWLASGCISPRQVYWAVKRFEETHHANDSTYWLIFEILWREFFQWQLAKYGKKMFFHRGIQDKAPTGNHISKVLLQWINGTTPYPIINAAMNQLRLTGFTSNRARQLVASCFIHELGQDWRYGAAYFEHVLVDFDPSANWGNWQYLAGVGSDPRGLRQFNLQKQTDIYDPHGNFIRNWT